MIDYARINALSKILNESLDDNKDLESIVLALGENPNNVIRDGAILRTNAQEMTMYFARRGRLDDLIAATHDLYPHIDLTSVGGPAAEKKTYQPPPTPPPQPTTPPAQEKEEKPATKYADFDISIDPGRKEGEYTLKAKSLAGETDKIVYQMLPGGETYEDQVYYLRKLMAAPEDAEKLGNTLRDFLFPASIWNLFTVSRALANAEEYSGLRIRLKIFKDSTELYQIPWEYVRDDRTFMALNEESPIVRYMPIDRPTQAIKAPSPVKILLAWANPPDLPQLDVNNEVAEIKEALSALAAEKVQIEELPNTTPRTLRRKVRKDAPHILHFIGHGQLQENGEGAIVLEDGRGGYTLVDAEAMLVLLQGDETKLVVLSACETAAVLSEKKDDESARALMGLAPKLVWGGTPAVLAMQFALPDEAGAPFMQTLYEFLADDEPLDTAVTEGRIGLYFDNKDKIYWAIPVLFMRSPDGRIWT